jgi:DNA replication protein DnaC
MATGFDHVNKLKRKADHLNTHASEEEPANSGKSQPIFIDLTDSPEKNDGISFKKANSQQSGEKKPLAERKAKSNVDDEPQLCREQRDLVDLILSGANVFYTGSAGCGKSTVLKAFVKELRDSRRLTVKIVAPTGRAAVDIGGQTLHAFAGLTPDSLKIPLESLRKKAFSKALYKRFRETDVLVIDEISMVENHFLERVSEMMKEARGSREAFGGMQVVLLGDFFQRKRSKLTSSQNPQFLIIYSPTSQAISILHNMRTWDRPGHPRKAVQMFNTWRVSR